MITFDNKIVTYNDKDGMISLTPSTIGDDTYSWQGRRLMSISGTKNIQFEYNEYGLRTFKRVDTGQTLNSNKIYKDYEYVYDLDNKLICQRVTYLNSIDTMIFLYHDDYLYGFEYAQSKYFYLRDSLGNINGIIDSTGKLVVEYVYNAFGKIIDILGEMKDTIGVNNPMRYKGYYYDSETQMYYCKSRYYNPDFCRWISGDSEKYIDTETPLGLNLFLYCNNDPVNKYDPSGNIALWLLALIGVAICGLFTGAMNVISKSEQESTLGSFLGGFFEGFVAGASLALGLAIGVYTGSAGFMLLGGMVAVSGGFIAGKYGNAITQKMSYGNVDWHIANIDGGISALTNLCTYAVFCTCHSLASSSSNLGVRFLENALPSSIGCGITLLLGNYEKPSLNDYRDEERIESEKGRFIWEYIL